MNRTSKEDRMISKNTAVMNQLLDKISKDGYDSLSDYEKRMLKNIGERDYTQPLRVAVQWLDEHYGNMKRVEGKIPHFNSQKYAVNLLDSDKGLVVTYMVDDKNAAVDADIIEELYDELGLSVDEVKAAVKEWLQEDYKISASDILPMFGAK